MWRSIVAWLSIAGLVTLLLWGLYQTPVAEDLQRRAFSWYQTDPQLFGGLDLVPIRWLQYLVFAIAAFGATWVVIDVPRNSHRILFCVLAIAVIAALSPTLALFSKLFEPASGAVAVLLSLGFGLIYASSEWGRRKHSLRQVFGGRVSKATMYQMLSDQKPPALDGKNHDVVILTVRLFDHGLLAERLERSQLVDLTNRFLGATSDFLCARGGFLDESSPDCVRVFFGLPIADEAAPAKACAAALELRQRLANLAVECESRWTQRIQCGVAVCSGKVTAGIFGEGQQRHYSAVGGGIDLCRRLTSANLTYGTKILVDAPTYAAASEAFEFRPIDRFYVPGSDVVTEFYELLDAESQLSVQEAESRDEFWKAIIHLRDNRVQEALAGFEAARQATGDSATPDLALLHFLEKTRELTVSGRGKAFGPTKPGDDIQAISTI